MLSVERECRGWSVKLECRVGRVKSMVASAVGRHFSSSSLQRHQILRLLRKMARKTHTQHSSSTSRSRANAKKCQMQIQASQILRLPRIVTFHAQWSFITLGACHSKPLATLYQTSRNVAKCHCLPHKMQLHAVPTSKSV